MIYLYLKVIHLISIISWMVGLLYLPRLFVYHSECHPESIAAEIFTIMEKRLMKKCINDVIGILKERHIKKI